MAIVCKTEKPLGELLDFPTKGDLSTPPPEVNGEDDATEYRYNPITKQIEPLESF